MSALISWITPDQLLNEGLLIGDQAAAVTKVRIYRGLSSNLLTRIDEIDARDPVTNAWIYQYEDETGTINYYYQISFVNSDGKESEKTEAATAGYISAQHWYVEDVRLRLSDYDPTLYRLDVSQYQWPTTNLWRYVSMGLNKVNQTGPMLSNWTLEDSRVPTELVKDWAVYFALKSKGILENWNQFRFNDGVSLDWDRSQKLFQASDGQLNTLIAETKAYKLAARPKIIGLGSQRLPFRILRPLSFLPNMHNVFGV